jgi:hypothetical protein
MTTMSVSSISNTTFTVAQLYTAVRTQQGRVQLDADSNEDAEANSEKIRRASVDPSIADGANDLPQDGTPTTGPASTWMWVTANRW